MRGAVSVTIGLPSPPHGIISNPRAYFGAVGAWSSAVGFGRCPSPWLSRAMGSDTETPPHPHPAPPPAKSWFLVIASRIHASPQWRFASWGHCQGEERRSPACRASAPLCALGPGAPVPGDTISFSIYSTGPSPLSPLQRLQAGSLVRLSRPL